MDYEKKYNEALERCRNLYNEAKANGYTSDMDDYEAIFPELKESEDERIRKALLRCCDDWEKGQFGCMAKEDIPAIRAYLEKQKEQKPIDIDFVSDWLRKHIKTYVNSEYNEFHKTVEYDGSINVERLIEDLKKATEQQPFARENDFVSKPAEWSEEDERMRQDIYESLYAYQCDIRAGIMDKNALELLKAVDNEKAWLKSLRPQPHWKPSEEQMDAIQYVSNFDYGGHRKALESLYNDLIKL